MKKVILSTAALMFGVVAFGQTSGNTGTSEQEGADNKIRVRQVGESNNSDSDQDGISNYGWVYQTGLNSATDPGGTGNNSQLLQVGADNKSYTMQDGDENAATTTQDGERNNAEIQQGVGYAVGNVANIDQVGNDNHAITRQFNDDNLAITTQTGDSNYADIWQNAAPNDASAPGGTDRNTATIDQNGNANASFIRQNTVDNVLGGNVATATVEGSGNYSDQFQEGQENNATVNQGNETTLFAGTLNPNGYGWISLASGTVIPNVFKSNGPGSINAKAFQTQEGTGNLAEAHQFGSGLQGGDISIQDQTGSENESLVYQNNMGSTAGDGNYVEASQNGSDNSQLSIQYGVDNEIFSDQEGENNGSYAFQAYTGNYADIYQNGSDNVSDVTQFGHNGSVVITQLGTGHTFYAEQSVQNPGAGMGNMVDVLQQGFGGAATQDCDLLNADVPAMRDRQPMRMDTDICPDCN